MKKDYWAYVGISLSILVLLVTCGGCDESNDESFLDDDSYSWVEGEWVDHTSYGTIKLSIYGDRIREDLGDGDITVGSYRIYDGAIHTDHNTYYPLDISNHRISDGGGGYFRKQ